jgi:hypothetical protein
MLTYYFNETHDFRYGKLFNIILNKNKNWKKDSKFSIESKVTLSDKNSKSKIQLHTDGEDNFILKHELAKNYFHYEYIPKTITIINNIYSDNINKLFDLNSNVLNTKSNVLNTKSFYFVFKTIRS